MAFAEQVRDVVIGISNDGKRYALWKAIFAPDNILVGFECYELNWFNEHYLDFKNLQENLYVGVENFVKYTKVTREKTPYQFWMHCAGINPDPAKFVF
jgi:hypothetical protein